MSRRRDDFEDDGRTVADMSGVSRPPLLGIRPVPRAKTEAEPPAQPRPDRPWEDRGMSRQERRHYIWGALGAAMLIALAFIVGLGLVVALFVLRAG